MLSEKNYLYFSLDSMRKRSKLVYFVLDKEYKVACIIPKSWDAEKVRNNFDFDLGGLPSYLYACIKNGTLEDVKAENLSQEDLSECPYIFPPFDMDLYLTVADYLNLINGDLFDEFVKNESIEKPFFGKYTWSIQNILGPGTYMRFSEDKNLTLEENYNKLIELYNNNVKELTYAVKGLATILASYFDD